MIQMKPDKEALDKVIEELESGCQLTIKHIVDVFGYPAVELLVLLSCNSPDSFGQVYLELMQIKRLLMEKK